MSSHLGWLLKAAIAIALLGWLLSRVDLDSLWKLLVGQGPASLLAMMLIQMLGIGVGTLKWRLLLPDQPFGRLLRHNMVAQFYSLLVPGQVGAEAIKAYKLGRGRIDAETIAASVMLDKITGLLALLALGAVGAQLTLLPIGLPLRLSLAGLFAGGVAFLFGLRIPALGLFAVNCSRRFQATFPSLERPFRKVILFTDACSGYLRQPGLLGASLAAGVLQQAIYIAMVTLLSRQLGFELPVFEWCWIFALVSIAAVLPISIAGLGVREGVFVGVLAAFAIPAEQALALSLTMFTLHVLFGLIGAALELFPDTRQV